MMCRNHLWSSIEGWGGLFMEITQPCLQSSQVKKNKSSHQNKGTYLENTERLSMTDPLGASPVDRENSIALLDPAVPVRQTSSDHFVHLREDN